jgi:hypothetical protein
MKATDALNTIAALEAILRLGSQLQAYTSLVLKARSEGREVSLAELQELRNQDDAARAEESAAIEAAELRETHAPTPEEEG